MAKGSGMKYALDVAGEDGGTVGLARGIYRIPFCINIPFCIARDKIYGRYRRLSLRERNSEPKGIRTRELSEIQKRPRRNFLEDV